MSEMVTVLRIKVDAAGVVTGMADVDKAQKKVGASADSVIQKLVSQNSHLTGLQTAYSKGSAAVAAFNTNAAIQNNILKAGVGATAAQKAKIAELTAANRALTASTDAAAAAQRGAQKSSGGLGVSIFNLRNLLAGVGIRSFVNEMISAQQSMDRMTNTLKVSGGVKGAAENMEFLREISQRLGLELESAGVAFAKFEVASQGSVLRGQGVKDIFTAVAEATTAMGLSSEVTEGAMLALQQMMSKGTTQSEELRGQFGERIPGAFRMAAEAMGMTEIELAKALETGRVLSADLLPKLADKLHETFGPQAAAGSQLLSAEINRLKNEIFDLFTGLNDDSGLVPVVKAVNELVAAVGDLAASDGAADTIESMGKAAIAATQGVGYLLGVIAKLSELAGKNLGDTGLSASDFSGLEIIMFQVDYLINNSKELGAAFKKEFGEIAASSSTAEDAIVRLKRTFDANFVGPLLPGGGQSRTSEENTTFRQKAIAQAYNNTKAAIDNMVKGVTEGRREMIEGEQAAKKYADSLEEMRNRFDPLRKAQEEEAAATALATDALSKNLITQENWQTIVDEAAAAVREKLTPGIHEYEENLKKLGIEIEAAISDNESLTQAYLSGEEAIEAATRAAFVHQRVQQLVSEGRLKGIQDIAGEIELLKQLAGSEYDSNKEKETAISLYNDLKSITEVTELTKQYTFAVIAGTAALQAFAVHEAAVAVANRAAIKGTTEWRTAYILATAALKDHNKEKSLASGAEFISNLQYETEWINRETAATIAGAAALRQFAIDKEIADGLRAGTMTADQEPAIRAALDDRDKATIKAGFAEISASFSDDLTDGMIDAGVSFFREFLETGESSIKKLGDMLVDVLLDAAMQYFAEMLKNQAKLQMSSGASGAYGPTQSGGNVASSMGGAGGSMGALGSVAMAAMAVYLVYSITDAIRKANDAGKFKETAAAGVYRGGVGSTYAGELSDQGRQMADALRSFLNLMQSVAGSWITSMDEIGVRVSGDGKKFQALVGGEIVGTFATMSEAMVRAFQKSFSTATFATEIDPIIRDMVTNFRGTDIEELKSGLMQVKQVLNEVSGLSDIEIAIKDLPFQADALKQSMVQLGASFDDASALAAKWQATQMQDIRNQITGHQATVAEQRAQKEREALMFNAQLALNKAEIDMKRTKLKADIDILKAGGSLNQVDLNLTTQYLGQVGRLTDVKAQLANQDLQIQQGHINLMSEAGRAALASLELQLAALDQVYAILDSIKPINLAEIRIPNSGGGGGVSVDSGPSEAEQNLIDFNEFLLGQGLEGLSAYERGMSEMNSEFDDMLQKLRESSATANEIYQAEMLLAAARRAAAAAMREELIDGFGTPLEAVRDRIAAMQTQLHDFYLSNVELQRQFDAGEISAEEFAAAVARSRGIMGEFGEMLRSELMNMALYFTDAMGDTEESARIRAELAQLEWTFKKMEFRMMLEAIRQVPGALSDTDYQRWLDFINGLPDQAPVAPPPTTDNGGNNSTIDDARSRLLNMLTEALDRLRNALEDYKAFQQELLIGPLSGATLQQQTQSAQSEYERLLALAQAGNLDAIEALPAAAREYLQLAGQFLDPSSAGYQSILTLVQSQMLGVQQTIEDVLNSVPSQMSGVEDRLDTIAEIMAAIAGAIGATGTTGTSANHQGMVYYGLIHGWHPIGWSPGGSGVTPDPSGIAAAGLAQNGALIGGQSASFSGASGVVRVEDEETRRAVSRLESKLDRIESAQVNDTNKAERYRRRLGQRGEKSVGISYRDEVAG